MNEFGKNKYSHEHQLKRSWFIPILYPIAFILIFLEWGWEPLANFISNIVKLPFFAKLELRILNLPPGLIMTIFLVPVLALLPFKFFALFLFSKGHMVLGTMLLILAKIVGTAICASLFKITKPKLMQIKWFAFLYPKWKKWKDSLMMKFRKSGVWRLAGFIKSRAKYIWFRLIQY